ncbi:hypothetical protein MPSEU_000205100 [Mayamaea pseudoterrestris]|nr:hypothetical protein MPSEU_000205100 [Mayamaea pseudoterrestris]
MWDQVASKGITFDKSNETVDDTIIKAKASSVDPKVTARPHIPSVSATAVLGESATLPPNMKPCRGHDFNASNDIDSIMKSYLSTGFQATNLALAIQQVQQMRTWRLSDIEWKEGDDLALQSQSIRERIRAKVFFAYTSNQISCGQREVIKFLVQHSMVDVIVTTAGAIEEDLIKCFQPTYMGDFRLSGRELRKKGINRIGNLLIPNQNYCEFEDWVSPIINKMHDEQDEDAIRWAQEVAKRDPSDADFPERLVWTPSKIIRRLGLEIDNSDSVLYWAAVNKIPIFCPALTDGSFGDMLYFHSYKRAGFILDISHDIRAINDQAVRSHCTGQLILGGGVVKHHTCNANLMRNGADYSVYINTASEFDGSDCGASPDEAVSWGKIRITAQPVKVTADATLAFPLLVSQTFAKDVAAWKESVKCTVCWIDELESE